jgi:DNA primase large subunit
MNSLYSNLSVYRDCYSVMLEFSKVRSSLPRDTRYTIAQDLSRVLMDMMVTIYRANSSRSDKARFISELRRDAVELQIYFRLLSDLHHLGVKKSAFFMDKVDSISKQLVAWQKSAIKECKKFNNVETPPLGDCKPEYVRLRSNVASNNVNSMNDDE